MFGTMLEKKIPTMKVYIVYGDVTIDKNFICIDNKYIVLKTPDTYDYLHYKSLALFKTIVQHFPQCIGCFKCDDDVILDIPSLMTFLSFNKKMNMPYVGVTLVSHAKKNNSNYLRSKGITVTTEINTPNSVYCGGPLYFLNRKSMNIISNVNKKDIDGIPYEDLIIGYILNKQQIFPSNYGLYNDSIHRKISFHNRPHKKTLWSVIKGGIGHQLFQVAAGYALAKGYDMNFYILNTSNNNELFHSIFSHFPSTAIENCNMNEVYKYNEVAEDCFSYVPPSKTQWEDEDFVLLDGSFQNETYFKKYKNEFIQLILSNKEYEHIKTFYNTKISQENQNHCFFIHIRRGDTKHYIDLQKYYKRAIEKILSIEPNAYFLVFSDDVPFCATFPPLANIKKDIIENVSSLHSLYLMSLCLRGGISGNSTFSWWGGYINQNPNKIIIFPNKWINNDWKVDIYPENAIVLDI